MTTIQNILKNIVPGQASQGYGYIFKALNDFYKSISKEITITYVKKEAGGTTVYYELPSSDRTKIYTIVIWFDSITRVSSGTAVKIYSDSPNFAYTFAYTFNNTKDLLYSDKYPQQFINIPPKKRNPSGSKGFDKHVYSCLKLATKHDLATLASKFETMQEPTVPRFISQK